MFETGPSHFDAECNAPYYTQPVKKSIGWSYCPYSPYICGSSCIYARPLCKAPEPLLLSEIVQLFNDISS